MFAAVQKKTQNVFDESCREGPVSGTANNYISQYLLLKCANYFFFLAEVTTTIKYLAKLTSQ